MAANRAGRINEEVLRELSGIVRNLKDPRIPMMTSIVSVNVTKDLRYATVYVSVFGSEKIKKEAIDALKHSAGFARRELGKRLNLRYTPELLFRADDSIEHGAKINELLHAAQQQEGKE